MKPHPRVAPARKASADLRTWLASLQNELGLTAAEMLSVLGDAQAAVVRSLLRTERHPDAPWRKDGEA